MSLASTLSFLLLPALVFGQRINITSGVTDSQVFQRDEGGNAAISLSGTAANLNNRPIEIRTTGKIGVMTDWVSVGKIAANKWSAKVTLPTGGPYSVEVRSMQAADSVKNILVGDLWVLGGQSNMEGVGDLVDVEPSNGMVHSFDQTDKWGIAEEPLHLLPGAIDRVHWRKNAEGQPERLEGAKLLEYIKNRKKGSGLGLPFASEMVRHTNIPIGLLPCAHGGTSMDQWSQELLNKGGDSLYGATIRRIKLAGGKVRGVLWYQGESDGTPKNAPEFQAKFERLVNAFRTDLGDPDLPFYYAQIGRNISFTNQNEWNSVQEAQRKSELKLAKFGMAATVDLSLDDGVHIGTQDQKRLGKRLANLACHDLYPKSGNCANVQRGPRPSKAKLEGNILRVTFSDVNGKLVTSGRVAGFSIHDSKGDPLPLIFRAELEAISGNAVLFHLTSVPPEGAALHYGAGKDPYANIRDEADMALPVFGPLPLER